MYNNSLIELGSFFQLNFSRGNDHFHSNFHKITLYCYSIITYSIGLTSLRLRSENNPRDAIPIRIRKRNASGKLFRKRVRLIEFFTSEGKIIGVKTYQMKRYRPWWPIMRIPKYKHKCTIKTWLVQSCRSALRQSANTTQKHTQHHEHDNTMESHTIIIPVFAGIPSDKPQTAFL